MSTNNNVPVTVSLESVGGVGDYNGSTGTDNTSAFLQAVKLLGKKGGTISIGAGDYLIDTSTILFDAPNICIAGAGREQTKITTKTLSNIFKSTVSAKHLAFKNLSIVSEKKGDGTITMIDLVSTMFVDFHSVSFYLKKPAIQQYNDICLKLRNCYFAVLNDLRFHGTAIPSPDLHTLTGKSTNQLGGLAVYAINNNALYINSMFTYLIGAAAILEDEDGAMINGISIEHCNRGIELTGDSCLNTIMGIRFESHVENNFQLLPYGEQFAVKFNSTTHENSCNGLFGTHYDLYHPCRVGVVDLGISNKYNGTKDSRKSSEIYRKETLVDNGDFRYMKANKPINWTVSWQPTSIGLSYVEEGLPKGINNAIVLSNIYSNTAGIKTKIWYDPHRHGSSITIKWAMKRFSGAGTGMCRWLIYAPNNEQPAIAYPYGLLSSEMNKCLPVLDSEWETYVFGVSLKSLNLSEATELTLRFGAYTSLEGMSSSKALSIGLANVVVIPYQTFDVPEIYKYENFTEVPDTGKYSLNDKIGLSHTTGYAGAVCVETPNTWKKYGAIET